MPLFNASLQKCKTDHTSPIAYTLKSGDTTLSLNQLITKSVSFSYDGVIICQGCSRKIKKSFFQGYCYPCFQSLPETAECILNPEKCQAHEGIGRDPEWEEKHHNQPHIVYLAQTSGIKVGVTRETQMPTRWIDQGAILATPIARTPNRYLAGCIEVALKAHLADKTSWQKMLKATQRDKTLFEPYLSIMKTLNSDLSPFEIENKQWFEFDYPFVKPIEKVKSLSFDKQPQISETLIGIKGQYLLFESGHVLNIRKHTGYVVTIT